MKNYIPFIILLILATIIAYFYAQANFTKLNYVTIATSKFSKGGVFRILQISDVHGKRFSDGYKRIIRLVGSADPDLIVLTGDIIDVNTKNFQPVYDFLDELIERQYPVYFVCGNHDRKNIEGYIFVQEISNRGIHVLNNRNKVIKKEGLQINLCGVDDPHTRREKLDKALNGINIEKFTILLAHSPKIIKRYPKIPVDLILSGHTHGGQIRLPFIGALVSSGDGFFPKYNKGLYLLREKQLLYIDSGLGTRMIPIRTFNRSQMSLLTIEGQDI
ncbi:metallophosphoesterase [Geosporobacter ferrireducens]|uniref:Calcineurin-like phosphoesterase domain-containing protein n=1 Tax=Geosporobacter ferrireducens TaxID=1424294 RepID=A0A1D8GH76_9FIRM|nr:metallophosphoesterase [Geosporobacter ferrireducens]AOT70253.1 hypothetical protein Gferi_12000 [Geosporobacter ferrireducens]